MIHVQNWKIYASHYDDDSTELGFELKKEQLHYKQYGEVSLQFEFTTLPPKPQPLYETK